MIDPLKDGISELQVVQVCGNDRMIVNAARVSYASDLAADAPLNDKDLKLIKFLIANEHGSPLEHNLITFRVKAPLYVVQEMLRHRIGVSINQLSARYAEPWKNKVIGGNINIDGKEYPCRFYNLFYTPKTFRLQDSKNKQSSYGSIDSSLDAVIRADYIHSNIRSFETYERLLSHGVAREIARGVLPHSTYTELYYTMNLRSLMHFLHLRLSDAAQFEIRQFASGMKELAAQHFAIVFKIMEEIENERRESKSIA